MDGCAVMTKTSKRERASDYELTRNVISEADRAVTARRKEIERADKCWKMYFAANGGQWSDADRAALAKEYRHAAQYNVVGPKIDSLAGALLADLPDISWAPVQGQKSIIIDAVTESYFLDKDLYDYDTVILSVFKAGLVHSGDISMYMDSRYGQKRICIKQEEPGLLVWDPYWMTDDDRDAEIAYRFRYLKADRIIQQYNHKSEEILAAVIDKKRNPDEYPVGGARQQRQLQGKVGDEYKVIEKHFLKHIKGQRLIGRVEGTEQWVPFPADKDEYYLTVFAELNRIDWETVIPVEYEDRVHYTTAVCEELGLLLTSEVKSEVQVNGLPFFHFSAKRLWGEDAGIVDDIVDLQQTINKRESLVTELISKANGGSTIVDNSLFLSDEDRERFIREKNKPGAVHFANLSEIKVPLVHLAANQYPSTVLDQQNRMLDKYLPLVSRASDALSSITESGDSGILFERKFQLNLIANTLLNRRVRQVMNNIGGAYLAQWLVSNRDLMQVVQFRDGRSVTLNERSAGGMIYNAVSEVPRCRVVVTENTKSQMFQMRHRGLWGEVLRSIPADVAPGHLMFCLKKFFETLQLTDEDKEELRILNEMIMVKARTMPLKDLTALQVGIQGDTLQSIQLQAQLDQMMQQAQMGAMGGGMPQEPEGAYPIQLPQEGDMGQMGQMGGMPGGGVEMSPEAAAARMAGAGANRPMGGPINDMMAQQGAPV
jgi:hypothetical protein